MRITDEDLEQDTLEEQIQVRDDMLRTMVYALVTLSFFCVIFFIILIVLLIGNKPIT